MHGRGSPARAKRTAARGKSPPPVAPCDARCSVGAPPEGMPERRWAILNAAYAVLIEKGYRGTSMIEIARRANASKETLYAWFGSKDGMFAEMIRSGTSDLFDEIGAALAAPGRPVRAALTQFAANLLTLITRPHVVAVHRAAIAEAGASPDLARILWENGRGRVVPALAAFMAREAEAGRLDVPDVPEACAVLIGLVIRNTQQALLLGMAETPTDREIAAQAASAAEMFLTLYGSRRRRAAPG